jgi:CRP-like cAMP-binding protein
VISTVRKHQATQNRLLALLPAENLERMRAALTPVEFSQGQVLYEAGSKLEYVYFVDSGMISVVGIMEDGASIELATIGFEGMAGLPVVLGVDRVPHRYTVQVAGAGRRMSVAALTAEMWNDTPLRRLLYRYHSAFVTQVMQGVACNGLHSIGQRCCRWLLTTQDRLGSDELNITHDFLAQMLGVRRASVTDVLRPLQDEGLIRATRGKVVILDPKRLADSSCECYRVIRSEYQRLLG